MTFDETSVSIAAAGAAEDDRLLLLSFDGKAELPFRAIHEKAVPCTYQDVSCSVTALQVGFVAGPEFG